MQQVIQQSKCNAFSYDGNPSPDNPDGVPRSHPDTHAKSAITFDGKPSPVIPKQLKIASFDIGIKNMAYCIFDVTPDRDGCWSIVDWNVVDLLETTNINITQNTKMVCGCLLNSSKAKTKPKEKDFSKELSAIKNCGKKAKYSKITGETASTTTTNYFCEKHAKNETQYLLPSKEYTLAHLRKQKVDGIVELYEQFCLSGVSNKKYPNKPEMIDSIMKYYTSRLFSEIPVAKKNANDANLIQIGWAIRRIFESCSHFANITHVVIENQISPIASRMKTIQGMLAQYFIMKSTLALPVEIVFVSSSNKLRLGDTTIHQTKQKPSKNQSNKNKENETPKDFVENQLITETPSPLSTNPNYKQHKKDGVALCSRFIESNIELSKWSTLMHNNAKKDDLADCFLQGVWFLSNRNIITCAENLKINIV